MIKVSRSVRPFKLVTGDTMILLLNTEGLHECFQAYCAFCSLKIVTLLESLDKYEKEWSVKSTRLQSVVLHSWWSLYHCTQAHFIIQVSVTQILGFLLYNSLLCSLSLVVYRNSRVSEDLEISVIICDHICCRFIVAIIAE